MRAQIELMRIGDDLFEFATDTAAEAQAWARHLRDQSIGEDVVAGLSRVTIRFHPDDAAAIEAQFSTDFAPPETSNSELPVQEIAVRYGGEDGPDLAAICEKLELSEDALIALHTSRTHTVDMMGFTPGFAYISGMPDGLNIPRLDQPRSRVPAGSVGLSAAFTGLYALAGPGGWPLIGRTDATLFSPARDNPFLLAPGQRVRFKAI